uniref:GNAT family N-acetyltransferase n=1 Tax=uncultured Campylobacter sp. TaxID=218934 RepID=UPI002636DE69
MRLERIGEDSALIARIEAINVAAFPEIERISIKNFLKMSRKGQLEIAAIFEDFSALGGGAADKKSNATSKKSSSESKNPGAASENLCAPKQDFCAVKQDCDEASQNRGAAGKNSDADNRGAAELASLSSENRGAADKKSNATCEKSSLKSKNPSAATGKNSNAAAQNLSGEELVGFFVYRTEQTYKRAISHHKQPLPRLNTDKILRSKAHSGAEFDGAEDEILGGEISSSAAEGKISSGTAENEISRYDESEIPSGGGSGIFYVAYLGIDAKFRGLGVGSRLLALIAKQNPRAQIVLDVEPPHEDA